MISKYDKQVVLNYIYGCDIPGYNIEELENDYKFMMDVINLSKDKEMYNMCSDEVKNNYEFVRFLVNKFGHKGEYHFIVKVVDNYSKNHEDLGVNELYILLTSLSDNEDIEVLYPARIKSNMFYTEEMIKLNAGIEDLKLKNEMGRGFIIIQNQFKNSDIVTEYFARRLIEEFVLDNDAISLEENIHKHFKTWSDFEKNGKVSFFINFISLYDKYLAWYLAGHPNILKTFDCKLKLIKNNWDCYLEKLRIRRINTFYDKTAKYIEENKSYKLLNTEIINEKVIRDNNIEGYFDDEIITEEMLTDTQFNEEELKYLKYADRLIKQLFKEDYLKMEEDYLKDQGKEKIIKFNFKKYN